MRILLFGPTGQIGRELLSIDWGSSVDLVSLGRNDIDFLDPSLAARAIHDTAPDFVINAAAYTNVDQAESEPDLAKAVNADSPREIAIACDKTNAALVHFSTDYVFDGSKPSAYLESDPINPLGVYGTTKELGEGFIRASLDHHIIVRTAWVYAAHGHNFVRTMLGLGQTRKEIDVVCDQTGCPTSAASIAGAVASITHLIASGKTDAWGTYHYCGAGRTTWYDFARAVFEDAEPFLDGKIKVNPIKSAAYPTAAERPVNSTLDCTKIEKSFGILPKPWRPELTSVVNALIQNKGDGV